MYTEQIYKEMGIIEFHPFRIEDKKMIDGFFRIHHYEQIDCTFNTLFICRRRTTRPGLFRIIFFSSVQDMARTFSSFRHLPRKKRNSSMALT